jgi:hypothetical protein
MVFEVTSAELVAADQYEQPSAYERVLVQARIRKTGLGVRAFSIS